MKLLIADDEALIRNGLKNSISWESLGISSVLLADDGYHALQTAAQERPEIILTDVRMPRMDGIELANRLHTLLPSSHLIFMSGYSDKEYLMAAIQLKAVSYVEKPINCDEIAEAVAEAVRLQKELVCNRNAHIVQSQVEKAQLAVALVRQPDGDPASLQQVWKSMKLPSGDRLWFSTILIQFVDTAAEWEQPAMVKRMNLLQDSMQKTAMSFLYSIGSENQILLHLYRTQELTREHVARFALQLSKLLQDAGRFYIAAGIPVQGIGSIYKSYQSAVAALNNSFFAETDCVLLWDDAPPAGAPLDLDEAVASFHASMSDHEFEKARELERGVFEHIRDYRQLTVDAIKNVYYKFITIMEWIALKDCVTFPQGVREFSPWQAVSQSRTVMQLHALFVSLMDDYVRATSSHPEENELVFLMKEYVRKNFRRDSLSVKEVADSAFLSTAYACTLFKNETGTTINQFISDYRIERAKHLLADPRIRITDIAAQLGFSDGNYFGKSFRRTVGLSPSEYREKVSRWNF